MSLRQLLSQVDATAPAIQTAAAAMMKHYNTSAGVAVNEWRNSLQACRVDQLIPLLYVANEVLQTSKRNRGSRFLEALSPVLGPSLQHICQRDPQAVEKVRRTVKIWGDRRVFSIRFVNELLQGLEPFRQGGGDGTTAAAVHMQESDGATCSPAATPNSNAPSSLKNDDSADDGKKKTENEVEDDDDDDDPMDIFNDSESDDDKEAQDKGDKNGSDDEDDEENDDDNLFGSSGPKLDLDIPLDSITGVPTTDSGTGTPSSPRSSKKRRRGSTGSSTTHKRRTSTVLSINNLVELWNRLLALQQSYIHAQLLLEKITKSFEDHPADALQDLVGDELQQCYRENLRHQEQLVAQRKVLRSIAQERHELEQQAVRYLPWLEQALKQDDADMELCTMLELKIDSFRSIHAVMKQAQEEWLEEERKQRHAEEERERKRREEEENERFRKAALSKETEAKPGMVWNPSTREYQALNTDESWRD